MKTTTKAGYYTTSEGFQHVILHGKSLCGRVIAVQPSLVERKSSKDDWNCVFCFILLKQIAEYV